MRKDNSSGPEHDDIDNTPRIYSIAELRGFNTSTRREFLSSTIKLIGAGGAALLTSQLLACEPTSGTTKESQPTVPSERPVAVITGISPSPAHVGDVVSFNGKSSDPSIEVTEYAWSIEGYGQMSDKASFKTTKYSFPTKEPGVYTVVFKVKNADGVWSAPVTESLVVLSQSGTTQTTQPVKPIAVITEMSPNPAHVGEIVNFNGENKNPSIEIEEYLWTIEDFDLEVSKKRFASSLATQSPGSHTVVFKVKSVDGLWSAPVTKTLVVELGLCTCDAVCPCQTVCSCVGHCTCDTVCTCVGHCTCDSVCTCQTVGGTICTCDMVHYWYPN